MFTKIRKVFFTLLCGLLLATLSTSAHAATVVVTNLNDSGAGSLRQALSSAAAGDTVTFQNGLRGTITLTSGQLNVTKNLTINGPGANDLIVSGNNTSRVYRISYGVTATIRGLTVANGNSSGAINVTVRFSGGGILNSGTLTIADTIIKDNVAVALPRGSAYGGGVSSQGTLTVINSIFEGNSARSNSNNEGTHGGGIFSEGVLNVSNSVLRANSAQGIGNGGGIESQGIGTVVNSTFENNSASSSGGAIFNFGELTVTNSTLNSNYAKSAGAGIYNELGYADAQSTLRVVNSTLSGNSTDLLGGGIYNHNGIVSITSSTIAFNRADTIGQGISRLGPGGGIRSSGQLSISNSIIAYNVSGSTSSSVSSDIDSVESGTTTSSGYNLSTTAPAGFTAPGDQVNTDPLLGPLQNNGGPTLTHALLPGSPAIDTGDSTFATDQRGVPRPQSGVDDIGAFEVQTRFIIRGYTRTNNLAPVAGVSVQLSTQAGPVGSPVLSDSRGFYQFNDLPAGAYTVTPSKIGWNFSPGSIWLNVFRGNRGANFKASRTQSVHRVQGRIANSRGEALVGVSVSLTPNQDGVISPVLTNAAGYYTFTNVPAGNYIITPSLSEHWFTSSTRSIEIVDSDVLRQNFLGASGYRIHGRVTNSSTGIGIPGVEVRLDDQSNTVAITNGAGYYIFYDVPDDSYVIRPVKHGYTFTPQEKTVVINGADVVNQRFIGSNP